jgi:sodium/potassium/calcium exchanger 6
MSMLWVYMLANLIVDIIELFDIISGVSAALIGLTILSWGNSVGDLFTSKAISK